MTNSFVKQPDSEERTQWLRSFSPSDITFLDLRSGKQLHEPSLAAIRRSPTAKLAESFLAAGSDALAYQNDSGAVVFSPLRHGQVADYIVAQQMFQHFYRQLRPVFSLIKPVIFVYQQVHTTEVEAQAISEAMIQTGARQVVFYLEALPELLRRAREDKQLKNACVLHIEPRD